MAQRLSNRHRDELYGVGRWTTSPIPSTSPQRFAVTAPGGYAPRLAYDSWVSVGVGNRGPLAHLTAGGYGDYHQVTHIGGADLTALVPNWPRRTPPHGWIFPRRARGPLTRLQPRPRGMGGTGIGG